MAGESAFGRLRADVYPLQSTRRRAAAARTISKPAQLERGRGLPPERTTSSVHSHGFDGTPEVMLVRGYPHMWWNWCATSVISEWWISTAVGARSCVPASAAASVAVGAAAAATAAGAPAVDSTSATVKPSAL